MHYIFIVDMERSIIAIQQLCYNYPFGSV